MNAGANAQALAPGGILWRDFMSPRQMTARELAAEIGVPANRITAILNGERAVTADTAIRLARVFKTRPEFWLGLQMTDDLYLARRRETENAETPSLVERTVAFVDALHARTRPNLGKPADKAFIDSLYE